MNKKVNNETLSLRNYLEESLSYKDYISIPKHLGISKKMFTMILNEPRKLETIHLIRLSELTNQPIETFTKFIEE